MKKMFALLTLLSFFTFAFSQTDKVPFPKTITVNGSAEIEIIPDEIYVQVDLKEYEKKGQGKINIETIKRTFLNNAKSVGIADSSISIAAYDGLGSNPWLRKKNRKNDLFASIAYQLKIKNSTQLDALVEKLEDEATQNFFIQRTSHSKIAEYRKSLKIAAIKAAKEKGGYLAEAINEQIGVAVTINEPTEYYTPYYPPVMSNRMMKEAASDAGAEANPVDFMKIKLKFDVTVVFALK
ncbi:MAG TPA: SIMPL domain-containing protein [Chitinophagaceae bacterium]|nr:SIMPL domain-containing protein [Chitinophagaceae bacterium]